MRRKGLIGFINVVMSYMVSISKVYNSTLSNYGLSSSLNSQTLNTYPSTNHWYKIPTKKVLLEGEEYMHLPPVAILQNIYKLNPITRLQI